MKQTSSIDRSRFSAHRTNVGQRVLSSWFRRPALWSLISLCTATALVLVVHAAKTENDHIGSSEAARPQVEATGRDRNDVMITVLANTVSGTVFGSNGSPITGGRVIKLIQNGSLSGATATSDSVTGIYTFTGLTLANGDKIAVYISGASEKAATVTFTGTSDITTLNIYQSQLVVRSDNGSTIDNAGLKSALGATSDSDLLSVSNIDTFNVVTTPPGIGLQIWTGTIYAPGANINDGGNWINNGTFTAGSNTVNFNGVNNQTIKGLNSTTFNNLTIANTGDPNVPSNIVSLDGSGGATNIAAATLTVSNGVFDQGLGSASSNLSLTGTGDVAAITSNGTWENFGTGDITLNGDITNNGFFEINANGKPCGQSDDILIRSSVGGSQRTWKGTGTFSMTDVDVQDQKVPGGATLPLKILVSSGTDHPGTNIGWTFASNCGGPFTWQGGANNRWVKPQCWSPRRDSAADAVTDDVLIFDGSVTAAPVVDEVPNQTNNAIHLTNGVFVTLSEPELASATLELHGATGQDLDVPAGTVLTLAGSLPFTIELTASGHQGVVVGQIIMKDGGHQLIGANDGEITITGGVTIASNYSATTRPFGTGTNGSVVFESGSTGTFNRGLDPFGGVGHAVVTFQSGSTASFFSAPAFFGDGGTYGNLILDGDAQSYFLHGSNPTTVLNNFRLSQGNTFVFSSTPGGDMNLLGNFRDETVLAGQFQANGRTLRFLGATQTIFNAGSLGTFSDVSIAQTPGGKVQLLSSARITGQLNLTNADSLLELNGQMLQLEGTVTGAGNLKGDPSANIVVLGPVGLDLGTVNFVSGGRTLSSLQLNRINASMTLGADLALAGNLRLDDGKLNTGANTLSLSPNSSASRTNGYVIGNLQKSFGASGNLSSFTFPLGTANAYSPLDANVTANSNGTLTAKAVQGQQPNTPGGANALQRYWTLNGSGITADLTFHYRGGAPAAGDVVGTEGNYKIFKYNGSFTQLTPDATGSNSATDHFATLNNVSSFSDWTLADSSALQPGTISFLNSPYSDNETNANHNATITVQRLSGSNGVVTVHYTTGDGTATAGSDYTSVSGDLTWAAGDTANKTFAIPIIGDTTFEPDETVIITLSAPTGGATIGGTNPATLTITNDDAADTNISVSGGNLLVSESGGNTDDAITLSLNGSNLQVNDPNHTLSCGGGTPIDTHTCEIPLSSITGSIQVNTLGGNDTLTLALAGGNFFPPGGVSYNGGDPTTAPGDKLIITGGNQGTVTYHYNNAHDGAIGMSNIGTVTFTGLEPISNTGTATDIIFELAAGPNSATLGDDGTAGNTISRLSGATFETTDFSNPTGSVTIKRGNAADTVTVNALPDFNASLAIGSQANPFTTITVGGLITLTGSRAATLSAGNVTGGGNISTGGGLTVEVTGTNSTLSGVISGAGGLTKLGTGTLVVSGADTYAGATTVNAGRLNINGSITSNATVNATGTLGGTGSINSANTLSANGGTVAPGTSPGILNTGNVSFNGSSTFAVEIGGPTPGNTASNHDQLNVTGTVSLSNMTLSLSSFNGFAPSAGQSFVIINNDGSDAVTGTFNGLAEGATITNFLGSGLNGKITYAGGPNNNDVVLLTVVPFCSPAPVVTNTGDNGGVNPAPAAGTGTLRQAMVDVCAGGTITFDTAGTFSTPQTITLSNQLMTAATGWTIDGADPATQRVTIAGGGTSRLFRIQSATTATIRDVTLTGGSAPGDFGGAIYNDHATLTLIGVTVSNSTADFGGGIYNNGASPGSASLTMVNSTISGNTTHFGDGGGIYNFGPGGNATLNITNSTISGNRAKGNGGGIISNGPTGATPVTITNCTITNNRANNENDNFGQGGGIAVVNGTPTTLRNSIVDLNFRGASPSTTPDDVSAPIVPTAASTHNLLGNCFNPCLLTNGVNNNLLNVSAASLKIGALAANGAINQTHALLPGSIGIEAGNNAYVVEPPFVNASPITDGRGTGFVRLVAAKVDIGAFEAPHNAPSSANNARTIAEDNNYTFALADFPFSDPNDTLADTFTNVKITSLATAGTLFFDSDGAGGNPPVAVTLNQLIPVADITAGHLVFTPAANASGNPYATFQFAVQDNGTTANGGSDLSTNSTFTITVTPQNDPPTLTTNAGLSVANGGTGTIDNTKLKVDDVDNIAAQLVYTIGTAPANGTLKYGAFVLSTGGTFTQADINGNQITYSHNGSATVTDSFTFTVSDGAGGSIGLTSFNITICSNPVVTNTSDSGAGSLRQALASVCDGGTITFDTAGVFATPQTITLNTELTVSSNVTIDAPDPPDQRVAIAGVGSSRLFRTQSGKTATIRDLNLTGGSAPGQFGGAIYNDHATLTLIGVTVSGNSADFGGGIYNDGSSTGSATLTIINSTISGNTTHFGDGGGIYNNNFPGGGGHATLNLTNSTISGNKAKGNGGGIISNGPPFSTATPVTITNCMITDNRANNENDNFGKGGGLAIPGGTRVTLRNSIVDLNFNGASPSTTPDDLDGAIDPASVSTHNLIGNCDHCLLTDGLNNNHLNVSAASLNIGPLAANGAINQTHALLPGSIAIDSGNDAYVVAPPFLDVSPITDERGSGFVRIFSTHVDIGAFEAGHFGPTSADNARTIDEDNSYTFALADFAFSDPNDTPADTFINVKITSLPTAGTLFFDADGIGGNPPIAVSLNQLIPVADITSGHLSFRPATDGNGVPYSTFQFAVQDSGTTGNGGSDLSTNHTFTMNVTAVNDAPTFQIASDPPTANEDAGLQTVSGFASNFQPGPPTATDEVGQTLVGYTLAQTVSTGGLTFSSGPAIDNSGTLTYTTTSNTSGTATFSVVATDSGSGTAPNVNQSAPVSFTITVDPQNDAPTLTTNAGLSVTNGGSGTIDSTRLLVSDIDNTANQLVYTIGTAPANGTLRKNGVDLSGGGTFTQDDINNSLITYRHNGSATLTDSFTFTVSDGAGGSIGSTTFNITITCANSITVTSNADSGNGALRQAIAAICDGGTITFDLNQVVSPITLASGLTITKNLTIQGPGANLLTITGNDTFGLIKANTAGINVNVDGLSITHGGPDAGDAVAIEFDGAGTLSVSNCDFSANSGASKAVIHTSQSTGLTVRASTLRNNTTLNTILSDRTPLSVVNSTISDNSGPGINNSAAGSTVLNSTIANNGVGVQSDGGLCGGCAASVTLTNTLLSSNGGQNLRTTGGGTITSGGHNLIDDATSAAFTNPADPTNIIVSPGAAGIAALANNGGPTMTRALMNGSPALDAGDNNAATNAGLTTDQRGPGFSRIKDGPDADTTDTVDIGAFEAQMSVTNATTDEDTQTTVGLVIRRDAAEGGGVTNFKITNVTGGTLFQNNGTTQINSGDFISVAEGNAGLKFTPAANLFSPATTFSFQAQASQSNADAGLIGNVVTATITVNPVADTPSVTSATTGLNAQTTSGLVISRNAVDGAEVTHFKITNIINGTLFKNDGTTHINNNDFITYAEGNAGLKFTPALNSTSSGSFDVQGATSSIGAGLSSAVTATITVACGSTTVTNSNDSGAGSLRSIINAACAGATITFDTTPGHVTSPITLTSGELTINKTLTITGPGANSLTISGNNTFRLMNVTGSGVNLTVNQLSFTGGGGNQLAAAIEFDNAGILTINDSEFHGNSNSIGGTVYANNSAGMTVSRSTVRNNTTPVGIEASLTPSNLLNSTVSDNTGYGIGNFSGNLTLTNSTIADNGGTGIGNNSQIGPVSSTLSNVLLSRNGGNNLAKTGAHSNTFSSNGRNVIDDNAFSLLVAPGPGDLLGALVPARLAPLAFNGGTTQTRALLAGSAALDAGDNTLATNAGLTTDQRGFDRIVDGPDADTVATVDIGAFEAQVSIEDISDKSTNEDTQLQFIFNVGGVANITSVTATSSDPTLVPNNVANIAVSGSGSTRTLTIFPAANLSGTSTITVTVSGTNSQSMTDTFVLTVNALADTPSVTNASTTVNTQTTSGLVISRSLADGAEVTNFKITNIAGGSVFKNNGTTKINNNDFITFAEGNAGLKFTPALNSIATGSFQVQASLNSSDAGLGGGVATAIISVSCGASVVSNSNDNGAGSLRDTILHACDGATITFDLTPGKVANPITLASGELLMNKNLIIQGPNADVLTIQRSAASGTPLFSIFNVPSSLSLALSGLTLSNGDNANNGGAIRNDGTLSLNSMALTNNHTAAGGSAVVNAQTGNATIANSTFSNNRADEFAAIYNQGGSLNLTNSTLTANANLGNAPGAAVFSESFSGVTNITNSTISQNTGQAEVVWRNGSSGALLNLKNTTVSDNTGGNVNGTTDLGNNLIGGNSLLAALGNYGGPTQTMALLPGSPAINAGTATGAPTTDQRGISRVGGVDIGAFESRGFTTTAASGTPQSATILSAFATPLIASITGVGGEPVNGGIVTFTAPAANASAVLTGGGSTANVTIAGGQASINATANGVGGSYNVTAGAIGATAALFSLTNGNAATTTAVTSSLNPSDLNQSVTFTATVSGAITLTGGVQFKDSGASLGLPVVVDGSGVAQLMTSALTVGNHTITAEYSGDGNSLPSAGTLIGGQTVRFRPLIKFSQQTYSVNENDHIITITVTRSGDTSLPVTVDYATQDDSAAMTFLPCSNANGVASPRCDFTTAIGTLRFAAGETSRTFNVLISQDLWLEGNEIALLTLSNLTGGAAFQQPSDAIAVLTIVDDDNSPPSANANDDSSNFVRQHYHDFLNREPDQAGFNFWVNEIESCGADAHCREVKRINVSAAFFLSIEFQNTGYFVERMYKAGFGDIASPTVPVPVRFTNFLADSQEIRGNIIVGVGNWQQQIEDAKKAFALAFVQRPAFVNRYPAMTSAETFVDSLNANAGMVLSDAERSALIAELSPNPADAALRADVLQKVAENALLQQQEFNRAFVLMQYFGYLRRNPDAAPEAALDFAGYNFWLNKLNQFNGDYVSAEMIKAFITSFEYRGRFGP